MLSATKEKIGLLFPLAAPLSENGNGFVSPNPHRGHQLPTAALYPNQTVANSNTATGRMASFYDFRVRSRCTGKERDGETGLDYFGARYFSAAQGRFTSPDWSAKPQPVPYADLRDPQTLNLYAYVRNNPLNRTDPDGHGFWQNLGNYLSYGVWGDEDAVKRAEEEAHRRLVTSQQQRASSGAAPMLYATGKTDANGRPVYTTDPSQLSRSAVLNPTGVDLRLSTNVAAAGWLTAAGRATVTGGVYTLSDPITGQVMYVGRSSNLAARKSDWANDPEKGDLQFNVFRRTDSYPAQRGLEQKLYDQYNPPLNRIRPISPTNPNLQNYIRAAEELEDQ